MQNKKMSVQGGKIANEKGFSFMELMVVISIIGILSSIILVNLNSSRVKARDTAALSSVSSSVGAVLLCLDRGQDIRGSHNVGETICSDGKGDTWPDISTNAWGWTSSTSSHSAITYSIVATSTDGTKTITCNQTMNGKCTKSGF